MTQPRPLASLSANLLARKGAARPAMRPTPFAAPGIDVQQATDDLGWNDFGWTDAEAPETIAEPTVEPTAEAAVEAAPAIPAVLLERAALAQAIEAPAVARSVSVATAERLRRETAHADKAAFTLRLDAERHLRLRLAGAISNRSAQALVTQALDALLQSMPTVDALVAQLPAATNRNR